MLINVRDTSSVSCTDNSNVKLAIYSPDETEHKRESSLSGYARLPYNAFYLLSSLSPCIVLHCRSLRTFLWCAFRILENRIGGAMIQMKFGYHPLHPSKLLHQCHRNSVSLFPILSFLPLDGALRPTWLRFVS